MRFLLALFLCANFLLAGYDFSLFKKGDDLGNTILVVGGIQGDEPGGFNAASLLATRYEITNGSLWIVPNLNFESIIKRSRGVYGDMNRKFENIKPTDPDFLAVEKLKKIILDKNVSFVVNLHDGSGFYNPKYISKRQNPNKWGQSSIIDKTKIDGVKFGNLEEISQYVVAKVNEKSLRKDFNYHTYNTKTEEGNTEMAKTLTWFAVKNNKPAFGNEASKVFVTRTRVFYHLLAVEAFMDYANISYKRDFKLDPISIDKELNKNIKLSINHKIPINDVPNLKSKLNHVPLKNGTQEVNTSNPLLAIVKNKDGYRVHYGNRRYGMLVPEYFVYDNNLTSLDLIVDDKQTKVEISKVVDVGNNFSVSPIEGYRINIIGYYKKGVSNEAGIKVFKKNLSPKFAIDKQETTFRVEVYEKSSNKFAGMVLVRFVNKLGS